MTNNDTNVDMYYHNNDTLQPWNHKNKNKKRVIWSLEICHAGSWVTLPADDVPTSSTLTSLHLLTLMRQTHQLKMLTSYEINVLDQSHYHLAVLARSSLLS